MPETMNTEQRAEKSRQRQSLVAEASTRVLHCKHFPKLFSLKPNSVLIQGQELCEDLLHLYLWLWGSVAL